MCSSDLAPAFSIRYMGRLEAWQKRIERAGASEWILINDIEHLDRMLQS